MSYLPTSPLHREQSPLVTTREPLTDDEAIALALAIHTGQDPRAVSGYAKVQDIFTDKPDLTLPHLVELTRIALRAGFESEQPDKFYALVERVCQVLSYEELVAFVSAAIEPAARPDEIPAYERLAGLFTRYTAIPPAFRPAQLPVYEQVERSFESARFERLADPTRGALIEVVRRRAQAEGIPETEYEPTSARLAARLDEIRVLETSSEAYQAYLLGWGWELIPVMDTSPQEIVPCPILVEPEDLFSSSSPSSNGTGRQPDGSLPRHERRKLERAAKKRHKKEQKRLNHAPVSTTTPPADGESELEGVFFPSRGKKKKGVEMLGQTDYVKDMIKCLQAVCHHSGHRPSVVFNDWIRMVEITLRLLPDHVMFIGETGRLPEEPEEAQQLFAEVRSRYENRYHPQGFKIIWENFCQAFSLLLDSTAGGLWGRDLWGMGLMGPDRLGALYMLFANTDPSWNAQFFTPWNVSYMMALMTITDGERDIMDRLKAACTHEDNIAGKVITFKLLLQGVFDDQEAKEEETQQLDPAVRAEREAERARRRREILYYEIIPAARPYYEPFRFMEPCIGSGVMMLAAASCFPAWAVHQYLVEFWGADIDPHCCLMSRVNAMLFGLNGYGLRLNAAAQLALHAYFQRTQPVKKPLLLPGDGVSRNGANDQHRLVIEEDIVEGIPPEFTFQAMFREWADHNQKNGVPVPAQEAVAA